MKEFRKKQKRLFKIMKTLIVFTVVYILIFIGVGPAAQASSGSLFSALNYAAQLLIIISSVIIFFYYSRYGKSDSFLERTEHELSDYAYYFTSSPSVSEEECVSCIAADLKGSGFAVNRNIEISDLGFEIAAEKRKEFFYVCNISSVSRNDVLAYLDTVINDITVHKLKRSGNAVLCFVTDKAEDGAIALSKLVTPLGRKEQLKIALAIIEPQSKKCYFLGNMETKCRYMILKYIMKCSLPIPEQLKGERRLKFQDELEEKMKSFNIKDFKDGTFYSH